jgi:hypothetical protein
MCRQEHLGMVLVRHLWLGWTRILYGARLDWRLRGAAKVAKIAMDYGSLEHGRFALRYRELFGNCRQRLRYGLRKIGGSRKFIQLARPLSEIA